MLYSTQHMIKMNYTTEIQVDSTKNDVKYMLQTSIIKFWNCEYKFKVIDDEVIIARPIHNVMSPYNSFMPNIACSLKSVRTGALINLNFTINKVVQIFSILISVIGLFIEILALASVVLYKYFNFAVFIPLLIIIIMIFIMKVNLLLTSKLVTNRIIKVLRASNN